MIKKKFILFLLLLNCSFLYGQRDINGLGYFNYGISIEPITNNTYHTFCLDFLVIDECLSAFTFGLKTNWEFGNVFFGYRQVVLGSASDGSLPLFLFSIGGNVFFVSDIGISPYFLFNLSFAFFHFKTFFNYNIYFNQINKSSPEFGFMIGVIFIY